MRRTATVLLTAGLLTAASVAAALPAGAAGKGSSPAGTKVKNIPSKGCPAPKTCAAYGLESYRWPTTRGIATLGFQINPLQSFVLPADAEGAILAGARSWSAAHGAVRVAYQGTTTDRPVLGDGKNTIGWNTLGNNNLATANVYLKGGKVAEADITLNAAYPWNWTPCEQKDGACAKAPADLGMVNRFDIQSVIAHEIGHWLGLSHLSEEKASEQSMYTTIMPGERKQTTLAMGDVTAVRRAYPCSKCRAPRIYNP